MRLRFRTADGSTSRTPPLGLLLKVLIAALAMANLAQLAILAVFDYGASGTLSVFDLSDEQSIGTWFTTLLLVSAAILAAALGVASKSRTPSRRGWLTLAAFIALLSVDEVVAMHERIGVILFEALELPEVLVLAWVVPAVLIVSAFAYWQRGFFARLPPQLRRRLVLAGAVYVAGAAGLEVVESIMLGSNGLEMDTATTVVFSSVEVVEEVLEMVAVTWALLAMLEYFHTVAPVSTLEVETS